MPNPFPAALPAANPNNPGDDGPAYPLQGSSSLIDPTVIDQYEETGQIRINDLVLEPYTDDKSGGEVIVGFTLFDPGGGHKDVDLTHEESDKFGRFENAMMAREESGPPPDDLVRDAERVVQDVTMRGMRPIPIGDLASRVDSFQANDPVAQAVEEYKSNQDHGPEMHLPTTRYQSPAAHSSYRPRVGRGNVRY